MRKTVKDLYLVSDPTGAGPWCQTRTLAAARAERNKATRVVGGWYRIWRLSDDKEMDVPDE